MNFKVIFHSYWHIGSGLSGGRNLDAVVLKDINNMPYIPGKTIKGLLRDAAESIKEISEDDKWDNFINSFFGMEGEVNETKGFISDACVAQKTYEKIKDKIPLYRTLSSTAMDKGVALDNSLRTIEVTIPLTLFGTIKGFENSQIDQLQKCFKWIKRLGMHRNKGLGICEIHLI